MEVNSRSRNAFTLIELLVVVGIVAVIAAILFPVFMSVRERGRRTTCQSNLKQISVAMQQYVQDNEGVYPPSLIWGYAPYSYLENITVFRCPSTDPSMSLGGEIRLDPPTSSANGREVWGGASAPTDYTYDMLRLNSVSLTSIRGAHDASLATPSTIWLNVDASGIDNDGTDHYGTLVHTSCGRDFGASTLHSGAGDYSYIDGHVKWLTPGEAGEIECTNGPLPTPVKG